MSTTPSAEQQRLLALVDALRPELHRYCARLVGSVIDGEDVVQDAIAKAYHSVDELAAEPALRAWLFRIAHNRALDLLRSRSLRRAEPLDAAEARPDLELLDPLEVAMREEAIGLAVSRFVELPVAQRSVVILKDVLDHSQSDIATLLDTSVDAVKAHLARGRANLAALRDEPAMPASSRPTSPSLARWVALFHRRDWDALRAMLAADVTLNQATRPRRTGAPEVGQFFSFYATYEPVHLVPAWLDGREVVAVHEQGPHTPPSYLMWLEWKGDRVRAIHDTRYARYVLLGAELVPAT